jgi:membrane protease YdiL (CAAX protease family)
MLAPLKQADRKQLVFWVLCTVLLLLKIFEGDQSFFIQKWGDNFEEGPLLDWYKWTYHNFATFILYAILPFIFIKVYFKDKLSDLGVCIGDWKFGLRATAVSFVVGGIAAYISSSNPEHLAFYPLTTLANESPKLFFFWGLCYLPHYIGLEFFMRGFMGFKLKEKHGVLVAIMVPMIIATLLHIGKPQGEAWGAAIAAIYLGLLTFKTKSILWPTIFHFYMGMVNTYFCGL